MTVTNGLEFMDNDRETKLANRRPPRYVPKPKHARSSADSATDEASNEAPSAAEASVVDLREAPEPPAAPPKTPAAPKAPTVRRRPTAAAEPAPTAPPAKVEDRRLRQAQLYLDATTDNHLRRIKAAGLVAGTDATYSAVVRHAVAEFVDAHGYDGIAELLAADPVSERGRGRPRR